jgi:hypothetical protein
MAYALIAALLTFALWLAGSIAGFSVFGLWVGRKMQRRYPLDPKKVPPRFMIWIWVGAAGFMGFHGGTQIGIVQAVIAFGDGLAFGREPAPPSVLDVPGSAGTLQAATLEARRAVEEERAHFSKSGVLVYSAEKLLLGDLREPLMAAHMFAKGFRVKGAVDDGLQSEMLATWTDIRPQLKTMALRKVIFVTALHTVGLLLLGLVILITLLFTYDELKPRRHETIESIAARARPS